MTTQLFATSILGSMSTVHPYKKKKKINQHNKARKAMQRHTMNNASTGNNGTRSFWCNIYSAIKSVENNLLEYKAQHLFESRFRLPIEG